MNSMVWRRLWELWRGHVLWRDNVITRRGVGKVGARCNVAISPFCNGSG